MKLTIHIGKHLTPQAVRNEIETAIGNTAMALALSVIALVVSLYAAL